MHKRIKIWFSQCGGFCVIFTFFFNIRLNFKSKHILLLQSEKNDKAIFGVEKMYLIIIAGESMDLHRLFFFFNHFISIFVLAGSLFLKWNLPLKGK